ncbi:hypothetical protein [uncultured Methanobrevibacter sp.]|nr:hypothetical protein [uncultured Methanobrevibacter sp.]
MAPALTAFLSEISVRHLESRSRDNSMPHPNELMVQLGMFLASRSDLPLP